VESSRALGRFFTGGRAQESCRDPNCAV
jgi:hypothetical protein